MEHECSIVRDILPLYVEEMVSGDTADFIRGHLENCGDCRGELERLRTPCGAEPAADAVRDSSAAPLRTLRKRWNKKKRRMIGATALLTVLLVLLAAWFVGSGFHEQTTVALMDYTVSEDGTEMTLHTAVMSSMGYVRGFCDSGGGVRPHYLTFYGAFGGLNGAWGAQDVFRLELDEEDTEIYFNRAGGGYELVLQKDPETGAWVRPTT